MKMQNNTEKEILDLIAKANVVHIAGHTNPDGDAISSCLALGTALEAAGKEVSVLLEAYGGKYDSIPNKYLVKSANKKADLFIALDCGDAERLGDAYHWFLQADVTVNIDHHVSNTHYGQYNFVQGDASSTSELVYEFLEGNYPIDKNMAAALYTGLIYDTGAFRHSSTSPRTMEIAAELMRKDIPFTQIYNLYFDSRSFSELKLMGQALQNATLYFDGKVIFATITNAEMAACNGSHKELDAIVNYLKGVDGVCVACFLYEKTENTVKASFRGADGYDVCALAQTFGGGGHIKAAGCTIEQDMQQAKQMVLDALQNMM